MPYWIIFVLEPDEDENEIDNLDVGIIIKNQQREVAADRKINSQLVEARWLQRMLIQNHFGNM